MDLLYFYQMRGQPSGGGNGNPDPSDSDANEGILAPMDLAK